MARIAICYWGLTRSTRAVHHTHKMHIRNVLDTAGFTYDIYMHTWATPTPMTWNKQDPPQDQTEHELLLPTVFRRENQEEFLSGLNFAEFWDEDRFNRLGCYYEWYPYLVRNMLCAMESQKRVTEMMLVSGKEYDYVMFVRPDALIKTPFPIQYLSQLDSESRNILIPNFDHCGGYNDRFAVMRWAHCKPYAFRSADVQEGRAADANGRLAAETFMKFIVDKYYQKIILIPFYFDLVRPPRN